jgi:PAS domain S-box-containing protein
MTTEALGEFDVSRLRAFAQRLGRPALIAGPDGACEYVNAAWTEFTGLGKEHAIGNGWQLALHPSDLVEVLSVLSSGLLAEQPFEMHFRFRSAHDEYAMFAATSVPIRDPEGRLRNWLTVCDRSDLEHAADDRFRLLADALPLLVWAVGADNRLTFANRAWLEYTGVSVGATLAERNANVHPLDLPGLMQALRGEVTELEFRMRRRSDGMYRWHYLRWVHMREPNRLFWRIGMSLDIHDQRMASEERDRQMRTIAEAIPDLVWSTNARGQQDYANSALLRYVGIPSEEYGGDVWFRFVNPVDWPQTLSRWNHSIETGEPYEMQHRLVRSDKVSRWFLSRAVPMRDEGGAIVRWFGTSTDIHDQKRIAQEQTYLAELGRVINSSVELDRMLGDICDVAVPLLADSCRIDLLTNGGGRSAGFVDDDGNSSIETIVVPMYVLGKAIGTISFVRPQDTDTYGAHGDFLEEVARRCALAIQNAQLYQREHHLADVLQSASLPRRLPQIDGIAMDAIYVPGRSEAQIGGDWYDAFALADGRVVVSIGDVAGGGLDAAVTMSNMRQIIRGIAQVQADPVLMLNSADRVLRMDEPDRFVTAFVGVIDPIASTMIYASAGHPAPLVRRADGSLDELSFIDLPLGLRERASIDACSVSVDDGDLLVFYTDGLVESSRDFERGVNALRSALVDPLIDRTQHPATYLRERVLCEGARDDVAILTLRIQRAQRLGNIRRWSLPSLDSSGLSQMRREFRAVLVDSGMNALSMETAELVLGELVGNVVRHASGPVDFVLDQTGSEIVLHVIDDGPGFERAPMLPIDVMSESGRGLFIVAQLTREFSVTKRHPRGSHARAVLSK